MKISYSILDYVIKKKGTYLIWLRNDDILSQKKKLIRVNKRGKISIDSYLENCIYRPNNRLYKTNPLKNLCVQQSAWKMDHTTSYWSIGEAASPCPGKVKHTLPPPRPSRLKLNNSLNHVHPPQSCTPSSIMYTPLNHAHPLIMYTPLNHVYIIHSSS